MNPRHHRRRAGFTLIELLIVIAIAAVLVYKISVLLEASSRAQSDMVRTMALEDQAARLLDRTVYALIGASRDSLDPEAFAPIFTSAIQFQSSLGVQDGEVVWSAPTSIELDTEAGGAVVWRENPDTPEERRVIWSKDVRELFEEELGNTLDDNGNDVIDEAGLNFVIDGDSVQIRLTLERRGLADEVYTTTRETLLTCRN